VIPRDPEADFQCALCGRESARLHTVAGRLVCDPACPAQEPRRAAGDPSQLPASTPDALAAGRPTARDGGLPTA
jgi:hypothetical protein